MKAQQRRDIYPAPISANAGFTMVELLVVVAIIGILAALLLTAISSGKKDARLSACRSNQKQLVTAFLTYANDDAEGSFGGTSGGYGAKMLEYWPSVDMNWLRNAEDLSYAIFFCPSTVNGSKMAKKRPTGGLDGGSWYYDLAIPANDARDVHCYSYDPLLWFADMEDYWNGNSNTTNSRFVPKTLASIQSYAHGNEAFDMEGKRFGPSRVWLLTDNDIQGTHLFWPDPENNHGIAGANTAFAHGHVEWIRRKEYVYKYEASQDNNRTRAVLRPNL